MNVKKGQDVFKYVRIGVNLVLSNNHPLGSLVTFHILGCFFLQYDEPKKNIQLSAVQWTKKTHYLERSLTFATRKPIKHYQKKLDTTYCDGFLLSYSGERVDSECYCRFLVCRCRSAGLWYCFSTAFNG